MKMYRASGVIRIREVEVSRVTEKSIWQGKIRSTRVSRECGYFNTWGEARRWLKAQARYNLETGVLRVDRLRDLLRDVEALRPPSATKDG